MLAPPQHSFPGPCTRPRTGPPRTCPRRRCRAGGGPRQRRPQAARPLLEPVNHPRLAEHSRRHRVGRGQPVDRCPNSPVTSPASASASSSVDRPDTRSSPATSSAKTSHWASRPIVRARPQCRPRPAWPRAGWRGRRSCRERGAKPRRTPVELRMCCAAAHGIGDVGQALALVHLRKGRGSASSSPWVRCREDAGSRGGFPAHTGRAVIAPSNTTAPAHSPATPRTSTSAPSAASAASPGSSGKPPTPPSTTAPNASPKQCWTRSASTTTPKPNNAPTPVDQHADQHKHIPEHEKAPRSFTPRRYLQHPSSPSH